MRISSLLLLCFLLGTSKLLGTAQMPDILLYQDDTLMLFSNPLEAYFNKTAQREIPNFDGCHNTANWRGYIAWWELRKDSLFLVKITNCAYGDQPEELVDLSALFPNRIEKKVIFADWLDGPVYNPYGERLHYEHMAYASIYQFERVFTFQKGRLKSTKIYENQVYKSPFSENADSLHQFFYQHIRWKQLPTPPKDEKLRVIISFGTDTLGQIIEPIIRRSSGEVYEMEAQRLLKKIGRWSFFKRRGEALKYTFTLIINFDPKFYQKKME